MSMLRQYERLSAIRDVLQGRLEVHEARFCFGFDDFEDGTTNELKDRIAELSLEMSSLRTRCDRYESLGRL
ncbi:hypothetical protein [Ensifer sp.]|jgi:hypothetical protein|uniref:hypothetical protein n=1 Tax=Ensifer sp. TaxID=1872086 RepID=UPI002E107107|nr:hypothetical protein [Ensifer sp.]